MALLPRVIDIAAKRAAALIRDLDWNKLTQLETSAAKLAISDTFNRLIAVFQKPYRRKVRQQALASNVVRGLAISILLPPVDAGFTVQVDDRPPEGAVGRRAVLNRIEGGLRHIKVEVTEQAAAGASKPPWVAVTMVVVAAGAVSRLVLADRLLSESKG